MAIDEAEDDEDEVVEVVEDESAKVLAHREMASSTAVAIVPRRPRLRDELDDEEAVNMD